MTRYRWTSKKPLARPNVVVQPDGLKLPGPQAQRNFIRQGDIFVPTEAELESFSDRIEEVKEGDKK